MINLLVKSLTVIGSCGGLALVSTSWVNPGENKAPHKVSWNNQEKTITNIERVEDIDTWGKENGCSFIFVKDWKNRKIYTAKEYAENSGGRDSKVGPIFKSKKLETTIVETINKYKSYCGDKLKTFTFLWNEERGDFYIGDPVTQSEIKKSAIESFISRGVYFWNHLFKNCIRPNKDGQCN